MKYRSEVDGLRAVAVLPVVLYHAGLSGFEGGYLGVDVFFVISGYLITSILYDEMSQGQFSIARFYERRARRILPVQYFIMLLCLPAGYMLMLPENLENFGQSLVATVFFSNNILMYLTSGYWVMEVDFKPLMHTWSLAVEEQYYFVVPIFMLIALRIGKKALGLGLILIFAASLALSHYMAAESPSFNFLMIFTRAWELVAGAFVALYFRSSLPATLSGRCKALLSWVGGLLLLYSFITFNHQTAHPSFITLLPVVGTALILMCANQNNLIGRVLSFRIIVLLGLTSYGSYLWHQPIFAFARIVSLEEPSTWIMLLLSCVALVLAFITWKYVEAPFRGKGAIRMTIFIPLMLSSSVVLAGVGGYWHFKAGFSQSTAEVSIDGVDNPVTYHQYNMSVWRFAKNKFESNGKLNILVVGNSFARDFINAGLENGFFEKSNLVYREKIASHDDNYTSLLPESKELIDNADYVVFASGYGKENAIQTMNTIALFDVFSDAKTLVIGTKNFGWNNNAVMLLPKAERYVYRTKVLPEIIKYENDAQEIIPETMYISILQCLIDSEGRVPVFTPAGKFISQDRRHFTQYGAEYVGKLLFQHPQLSQLK
jgi:peptidoglycan/LPS O-acetylase OafA/YrhL